MVDEQLFEALAKVRDCLSGAADALDTLIQQESKTVLKQYDPEKMRWADKNGAKGSFQATDDVNSPEYKALQKDLVDHKGFIVFQGFQYWLFENGVTIGRRKKA